MNKCIHGYYSRTNYTCVLLHVDIHAWSMYYMNLLVPWGRTWESEPGNLGIIWNLGTGETETWKPCKPVMAGNILEPGKLFESGQ